MSIYPFTSELPRRRKCARLRARYKELGCHLDAAEKRLEDRLKAFV